MHISCTNSLYCTYQVQVFCTVHIRYKFLNVNFIYQFSVLYMSCTSSFHGIFHVQVLCTEQCTYHVQYHCTLTCHVHFMYKFFVLKTSCSLHYSYYVMYKFSVLYSVHVVYKFAVLHCIHLSVSTVECFIDTLRAMFSVLYGLYFNCTAPSTHFLCSLSAKLPKQY